MTNGPHRKSPGRFNRRQLLLGAAGLAGASFSAGLLAQAPRPASGQAGPRELDALIKAARAEGQLTLYTSTADVQTKRFSDAFTAAYGVKASFLRLSSAPLQQRYGAEAEAGNIAADVMFLAGAADVYAAECVKKGWMEPVSQAGLPSLNSGELPGKFNRGVSAVVQVAPWLITYNTDRLKGADVPRDWTDLLNPKLKGQIIIPDPRASAAFLDFWSLIIEAYGPPFFKQLRALEPRFVPTGTPGMQALGAGEGALMVPTTAGIVTAVQSKGAPVSLVIPDRTTGVEMQVMLTQRAKARNPNAARLFANYALSREGNKVLNDEPGGVPIHDASRLPKQYEAPRPNAQARQPEILNLLGLA